MSLDPGNRYAKGVHNAGSRDRRKTPPVDNNSEVPNTLCDDKEDKVSVDGVGMHGSRSMTNPINYQAPKSLSKEKGLEGELGSSVASSYDTLGVDKTGRHSRSKNAVRLPEVSDIQYDLASDLMVVMMD
ncbi:unnamed protein product, partial [Heterobilharzia americana]